MAVNAYGQTYVGNDDFKGWLAANADKEFQGGAYNRVTGAGLNKIVGNDGTTGSSAKWDISAAANAFKEWQNGRQTTVADQQAGAASSAAARAEAAQRAQSQAALGNTQKAIDSLGTELQTGYGNIDAETGAIRSRYDREAATNEADYNDQTVSNNQSLLKNKQNSLQAAAQGARGLRGTLASIGALGGDGIKLANRAVTTAANQDVGQATETAAGNSQTLDKAIGRFREEDRDRRNELDTQARNNRTALEGRVEAKRQSYYQKMADLFGDLGNGGEAANYLNRAGDLNNTIASKTAVAAAPIASRGAAFTPGSLADYLAGAGDMTVSTAEGDMTGMGTTPSSILAGRKDEKRRQTALVA